MSTDERPLLQPWFPVVYPATGRPAIAVYLRAHLYGAAVGRRLLDRCIQFVDEPDRLGLLPLQAEFDHEIATARRVLAAITPVGTPGRSALGVTSGLALAFLPVGPRVVDPLSRLALLESLRTLVVAKKSMWTLLSGVTLVGEENHADLEELADQAAAQEALLERLRVRYGRTVFG